MRVRDGRSGRRTAWRGIGCLFGLQLAVGLATPVQGAQQPGPLTLQVLSNRADLVSGGDALVEVSPAAGLNPRSVRVDVDGRDVTAAFAMRPNGRFEGLLTGLKLGSNIVTARAPAGGARLTITNHPLGGPIISGPQIQPWYCLAGAEDAQCDRPIAYTWQYKSTDPSKSGYQSYDPNSPPSDVAATTTDQGRTVPYIVRLETGDMDRGQYRIAVLDQPTTPFDRWTGPVAWNHKLFVPHGAGCSMNHVEGPAPDVMSDEALSRGFAVMSTELSDDDYNCNLAVQAESIIMAKEHVIEAYGDVRYTIGIGCSGGSIASLTIANAYPGLYDGLIVACTMPEAPVNDLLDCKQEVAFWENPAAWSPGVVWTESQQAAAAGLASTSVCHAWVEAFHYPDVFNPTTGVGCGISSSDSSMIYNAQTNPGGLRCSFQDYMVNVFGLRPPDRWGPVEQKLGHGFANRWYDNVGVQYGLRALQSGQISPAQFADLNAKIGGIDIDYNAQAQRIDADPAAISRAYASGVVNEANNLNQVAIIDIPGWSPGDRYEIHDNQKSWGLSARLDASTGTHANHAMWYGPDQANAALRSGANVMGDVQAFTVMDEWMTDVERDHRAVALARKVVDDRPADSRDRCDLPDASTCNLIFGPAGNARWGAGEPTLANDVIKCRLKPLTRSDYAVQFTDSQWAQLQSAFPHGVCDWSRPGVDQQPAVKWQTYADGPGGRPLGASPNSIALAGSPTTSTPGGTAGGGLPVGAVSIPDTAAGPAGEGAVAGLAAGAVVGLACVGRRRLPRHRGTAAPRPEKAGRPRN